MQSAYSEVKLKTMIKFVAKQLYVSEKNSYAKCRYK